VQLARLTYVYESDPGVLGRLLAELGGTLRFGEGSGLIDVGELSGSRSNPPGSPSNPPIGAASGETSVRIVTVRYSELLPETRAEIGLPNVPCVLGHSGTQTVLLLPPRSLARVNGGLSDLRGKLRYALAKVDWTL
jgi:hypothetical protein